jgi:hypothetical protein
MKKLVMIIILLLAAAAMAATEPGTEGEKDVQEENVQSVPAIKAEVNEKSPRDENWPLPFIPSEKIGADSVVSFPADI